MSGIPGVSKRRNFMSQCGNLTILVFCLLILFATEDLICTVTLLMATYTGWDHYSSPIYMSYLKNRWEKLPEVKIIIFLFLFNNYEPLPLIFMISHIG
jgi:hypothetical protein